VTPWSVFVDARPRPWKRSKAGRAGRRFTPWTGFHHRIVWRASQQLPAEPLSIPLRMIVEFRFAHSAASRRRGDYYMANVPDGDNLEKGVGDRLEYAGVLADDRYIVETIKRKVYTDGPEGAAIILEPADPRDRIEIVREAP